MYCKECGAKIGEGHRYCENCGAPVIAANKSNAASNTIHDSKENVEPHFFQGEMTRNGVNKKNSIGAPMIAAIACLVIAGILAFGFLGSPKEVYGLYTNDNLGLPFSGYEFYDDGSVTFYCAGMENSYGTYEAKGRHYELTIDSIDYNSYYAGEVESIQEGCKIIVKPKDEDTIEVKIKAKKKDEIFLGQLGKELYTREY